MNIFLQGAVLVLACMAFALLLMALFDGIRADDDGEAVFPHGWWIAPGVLFSLLLIAGVLL